MEEADLWVTVSSPSNANINEVFDVTVGYGNNGPDATGMLTQISANGPGTIQALSGCNISNPPNLIGCPIGTVGAGGGGSLTYQFRVTSGNGTYSFNVSFQTSADVDPVSGNNNDSDTTSVP